MKYKVGDKIKIREWDDMEKEFGVDIDCDIETSPCFIRPMKKYCGKTLEITKITCAGTYEVKGSIYIFSDGMIVKENEMKEWKICKAHKETIVIYRDGNSVIANDKETGKKAVAKCHPDDEFDFMVGAKLALERLSQSDEPEYYNGKVVCVESLMPSLTVGKIYNVKDGQFKDDDGDVMPKCHERIKSFEDFGKCFVSEFIEIVE